MTEAAVETDDQQTDEPYLQAAADGELMSTFSTAKPIHVVRPSK